MTEARVEIYDIMACNVYMDFDHSALQKEQHKFLVAFYPTGGAPIPELVTSITARGPGGYEVAIANQEFTAANRNGWIYDRTTNSHWYMVNLDTGFMKEGEYTIEVRTHDGRNVQAARRQTNRSTQQLVSAYTRSKDAITSSWSPSKLQPFQGSSLRKVPVTWSSLKTQADVDAYYIFRLSEGRSGKEFNTQKLVWWDNIFTQRLSQPEAGLNRDSVVLGSELSAGKSYVYFVEVTDSNAMGRTNICIFQPHQAFTT
ncbi:MAG: hypothetical protein ABW352_04875 [Polyangiales bacterium]